MLNTIPDEIEIICKYATIYYNKGWLPATAGNLSFRETEDKIWITASGLDKGRLTKEDFIPFSLSANGPLNLKENQKPSAETSIHRSIYLAHPTAKTIFHLHNINSLRIQLKLNKENSINHFKLPPLELIKAFGIWEENPIVNLPVFYNHGNVSEIANDLTRYFENNKNSEAFKLPLVMIENHGPTFWGKDSKEVNRFIEAFDYIASALEFLK